jgi:maltose/maltodextrin transport system substrate-binding protein
MMQNPVRTWNWQGQFEDVQPQPPYENLTKHEAGDFAIHLLETAAQDEMKRRLALDLIRYAEDQFVIWSQPPADTPNKQNDDGTAAARTRRWMLPCVLEQYRCWAPVCASSAKLIRMYLAAYHATQDTLHLEKARALASTLTLTQSNPRAPGRYQTWLMQSPGPMWFNCELMAVRAIRELASMDKPAR